MRGHSSMFLKPNWTYKFSFVSDFSSLDGVYTVKKIYAYVELLDDNLSLLPTYEAVGKTQADLENDVNMYRTQEIYKLVHPEDETIIWYIPEGLFSTVPNYNVKKYSDFAIALRVGIYPDEDKLIYVQNVLQQQLSAMLGFTNGPDIISVGEKWLTDEEYKDAVADREQAAKTVVNYFSENIELRKQIDHLKDRCNAYEEIIIGIANAKNEAEQG